MTLRQFEMSVKFCIHDTTKPNVGRRFILSPHIFYNPISNDVATLTSVLETVCVRV